MPTAEQMVRDIQQAMVEGERASIQDLKEELWARCLDVVSGLAVRYTRKAPHLRDDFINDGYVKFEQVLETFQHTLGVPFRGYLSRCVQRCFHDKVRKRTEQRIDAAKELPALYEDVDARLHHEEIAGRIDAVLASLLPRDRQRERKIMAFRLRRLEGWTVEEIRDWLNAANGNLVSQWIHRVGQAFAEEFPRRYPEYFRDLPAGPALDLEG